MSIYDKDQQEVVNKTASKLKTLLKAPEWSYFVKTGAGKERPPVDNDWWYYRAASVLRKVYLMGPIGVSKLRTKYGSKKNRGHKPERFYKGSGKVIRTVLQQLEEASLIEKSKKGLRKGRIITNKGKSLLEKDELKSKKS
nr:30S ribosomal protein S19e [Candidatus Woesearchaeota archaeon]